MQWTKSGYKSTRLGKKENMDTNLQAIISLRQSKVQSSRVKELLNKRLSQAKSQSASLRRYAALKNSRVAAYCNKLADEIDAVIEDKR